MPSAFSTAKLAFRPGHPRLTRSTWFAFYSRRIASPHHFILLLRHLASVESFEISTLVVRTLCRELVNEIM